MKPGLQNIFKAIFFISILFFSSKNSCGQANDDMGKNWKNIEAQYQSGKINDTTYLNLAGNLAAESYKDTALKQRLKPYQKIAWSKKTYQPYRIKYYSFLTNNATFTYKAGASIYYAEKLEEELKNVKPYMNTLNVPKIMVFTYGRNRSGYYMCTNEINRVLPFLKKLPQIILTDSVPRATINGAMNLLADQAGIYTELKDTNNVYKVYNLAEDIWNAQDKKNKPGNPEAEKALYFIYITRYLAKKLHNEIADAKKMLDKAYAVVYVPNAKTIPLWKRAAESDMLLKYTDFFIAQNKNDSAEKYLQLIKSRQDSSVAEYSDGTVFLVNNARLKANEGNYKTAYENIMRAYEINDSVIGLKTADITNNMYAQTMAEFNSEELKKSAEKERKRNILIGIISFASLIIIAFLYRQMKRKERDANDKIYKLNYASQLQIMELEEQNRRVKQDEQRRLGMDLHDNLAGTIAAVKIKIERELIDNPDTEQANRLKNISSLVTNIYESTRNKSHELYKGLEDESEIPFSKRIKMITNNSFSLTNYAMEIEVDDYLLKDISLKIKIELLYIIQEAITNIIKHAMANKISIFIYEDIPGLILQVTDDGKGFDKKFNGKGIGLRSIKDRAAIINGKVDIAPGKRGTEVKVTVPVSINTDYDSIMN